MKLKPLFDRVIVAEESPEQDKNGIFIGAPANNNVKIGKVLYAGEGNLNDDGTIGKMFVKEGDHIVFMKFSAAETSLENKPVLILRQTDILAIIE